MYVSGVCSSGGPFLTSALSPSIFKSDYNIKVQNIKQENQTLVFMKIFLYNGNISIEGIYLQEVKMI